MTKYLISFLLLFFCSIVIASASDLIWDPSEGTVKGYKIYSTDSDNVTKGKVILPGDYSANDTTVRFNDFPRRLNLKAGETYKLSVTAWNDYGESGHSNVVSYKRKIFEPENTEWPSVITLTVTVPVDCAVCNTSTRHHLN